MKNPVQLSLLNITLAAMASVVLVACDKPAPVVGMAPPSTTVGTEIDDSVVTVRVKSALLADADIKGFDFKVETRKGVVLLSGFVDNQIQLDRATEITHKVAGVKSIENNMTLKGVATSVGNQIDDSVLTGRVKSALLADERIKSLDIAVVTRKGEVQLSGFVDNQAQIDLALQDARAVEGVGSVSNQMSVKK